VKPRPCPTCHSTRTCASTQIPTIWQCLNRLCEVAFFDSQGVMAASTKRFDCVFTLPTCEWDAHLEREEAA